MSERIGPVDVIHQYVHEGLWQDYSRPAFKSWVWTLRDSHALIVLALFTLLMTLAQRQSWSIIRQVIAGWKGSIRLRDETCSDPLQHLSQLKAMKDLLSLAPHIKRLVCERLSNLFRKSARGASSNQSRHVSEFIVMSPYFGLFAFINVILFIVGGVVVPWLIYEGWQSAPVVRSKIDDECAVSSFWDNIQAYIFELPKVDAVFQGCLDQLGCEKNYQLKEPIIKMSRPLECPFGKDICIEGIQPVELSHYNLTAFEAGINIKSRVSVDRRVTCTPVKLLPMMVDVAGGDIRITIQETAEDMWVFTNSSIKIETLNGPNRVSRESSGRKMAELMGARDISVLPRLFTSDKISHSPSLMSHNLFREDGESFLIVRRGGPITFDHPVDDPFFSAHQNFTFEESVRYYSDYEATALGCVEQVQYCLLDVSKCSGWGSELQKRKILNDPEFETILRSEIPKSWINEHIDHIGVSKALVYFFSLHTFLADRFPFGSIRPPLLRRFGAIITIESNEQWVFEVEKWFRKAYLNGIFMHQNGAQWNIDPFLERMPLSLRRRHTLCGRVIFRDKEHTNINFVGLCVCTTTLCLLCLGPSLAVPARYVAVRLWRFALYCTDAVFQARTRLVRPMDALLKNMFSRATNDGGEEVYRANLYFYDLVVLRFKSLIRNRLRRPAPRASIESIILDELGFSPTPNSVSSSTWTELEVFEDIDNVI